MAETYIQLPDDASNTGKKVASRTRTQGADTVHDHVFAVNEFLTELPAGTQNIGDVDVASLPALPAGNNNIGDVDVASIAAGDNNIGNVDVVTLPALVAGSANIGDVDVLTVPAPLSTAGGGTEATALRVTIANDSTGLVSIDDNGASITVDGTVTTTPSGDHTVVGKAADGAAVSGNPVLIAGQDGTNVQSIKTDTSGELQVDVLTEPARVATTDSITAKLATDKIQNGLTAVTPLFAAFGVASAADNVIATNTNGGLKIRVLALFLVAGAAGNIYFRSDTGGSTIFGNSTNKINLVANSGFVLPFNPVGWFETAANHDVVLNASTTGPFSGGIVYIEV